MTRYIVFAWLTGFAGAATNYLLFGRWGLVAHIIGVTTGIGINGWLAQSKKAKHG